jgi:hypothetical protein
VTPRCSKPAIDNPSRVGVAAAGCTALDLIGGCAQGLPVASRGIVVAGPAVAPVIAKDLGARRAGQGRAAVSVSERSLEAPQALPEKSRLERRQRHASERHRGVRKTVSMNVPFYPGKPK